MSGQITFGGLASGLDSNAIIQALVQAEQIPIKALQGQKSTTQGKLSLLGDLSGMLDSLRDKADSLSSAAGFVANTVVPSEEGIATFTATGGALDGSYSLEVLQLARASRYELTPQSSPDADLNGVDISFDIGPADGAPDYSVSLNPGSSSLNDVAAAINDQLGDVARATVINTGTSSSPSYSLVLESTDTGLDNAITNLTVENGNLDFDVEQSLSTAQNAQVKLNDLTIERSSNEFGDVIDGISFTVESTTAVDTPITFNVGVDDEKVIERLTEFVDAYNEVMDFINGQSSYSTPRKAASAARSSGIPLCGASGRRSRTRSSTAASSMRPAPSVRSVWSGSTSASTVGSRSTSPRSPRSSRRCERNFGLLHGHDGGYGPFRPHSAEPRSVARRPDRPEWRGAQGPHQRPAGDAAVEHRRHRRPHRIARVPPGGLRATVDHPVRRARGDDELSERAARLPRLAQLGPMIRNRQS
jgi:hypothetical protein